MAMDQEEYEFQDGARLQPRGWSEVVTPMEFANTHGLPVRDAVAILIRAWLRGEVGRVGFRHFDITGWGGRQVEGRPYDDRFGEGYGYGGESGRY